MRHVEVVDGTTARVGPGEGRLRRLIPVAFLRVRMDRRAARVRHSLLVPAPSSFPAAEFAVGVTEEPTAVRRASLTPRDPSELAAGRPPPEAVLPLKGPRMSVRVLAVRGGADTPTREGPMPPRVTVGTLRPTLGWATGWPALRARAGRLKGPNKTVTAAMAFLEGVTDQGVAAIP